MNYIVLGGSGFIGTHLMRSLVVNRARTGDAVWCLDLVMPGEEGVVPGVVERVDGVTYVRADVRRPIELDFDPTPEDVVFNLAAVHRTPGHADREYFETNIEGARNAVEFCERHGIRKLLFTSSIAPYGASEDVKREADLPLPNTPYGISKLVAEEMQRGWQRAGEGRRLVVLRPGVVFGKGEHGNFTRLYKGLRGRYFAYTGRRDTVKACIYVKDLVAFAEHEMLDQNAPEAVLYNCTFEPAPTIEYICKAMMLACDMPRRVPMIPGGLLMATARLLGPIGGKKVGIHPDRVRKLMVSTNISGERLEASGFELPYTFEESIVDWFEDCGREGLF